MLARLVASAVALGAAAATSDCSSCVERGDSVVKVITHGVWSNTFWTLFRAAAVQAAADPGVALDMELRETWDSDVMAAEIDGLAGVPREQAWAQAYFATYLAAIHAFAGLPSAAAATVALPAGPLVADAAALPTGRARECLDDSYATCAEDRGGTVMDGCARVNRSRVVVAGVVPGAATDGWWDLVADAAADAASASDLGVSLARGGVTRTEAGDFENASRATFELCGGPDPVDGLFVKLSSELLYNATRFCVERGVAVASFNSGFESGAFPVPGLLHHVGLPERETARDAAAHVLAAGGAARLYCVVEAADRDTPNMVARCAGVADAAGAAVAGFRFR
ncbi:sterol 14-demethylase [Aureococcus anophagefferens]|nr:sterol 14-demethylase [Aureococcus anophagefferens]